MGRRELALLAVPVVAAGGTGTWFYNSFVRRRVHRFGADMYVVSGGGGNTVVVGRGDGILVVDTKFGPGATALRRWIDAELGGPVTVVLNTHFHYDHIQGNALFPESEIWAHEGVPALLRSRDGDWWRTRERAIPTGLIGDDGRDDTFAGTEVVVRHPGVAHTHADLYAYFPEAEVVVTGDLLFHTYYPFFDTGDGGAALLPLSRAVRRLADTYPEATFVPGHGPLATAGDLRVYAGYLEHLYEVAEQVAGHKMSATLGRQALSRAPGARSILPSFHENRLSWATPRTNLRWCCELVGHEPTPGTVTT